MTPELDARVRGALRHQHVDLELEVTELLVSDEEELVVGLEVHLFAFTPDLAPVEGVVPAVRALLGEEVTPCGVLREGGEGEE